MSQSLAEVTSALTAAGAPFEIEEVEIRGVVTRTWKNAPASLRTVLDGSRLHGEKIFLVYEDERISFSEHWNAAARLAIPVSSPASNALLSAPSTKRSWPSPSPYVSSKAWGIRAPLCTSTRG